jgi:hypothetical protein
MTQLLNALPGALVQGLIWGVMAIGVYITYKVLDIADLTVDGSLCTGAAVCIQHISSKNAVEYVRTAKKLGADVHAEATPHHFTLTDKAVLEYGTLARMNPPVRTEDDRLKIIEGIKDGTIDMIVTDHAPHSTEEKARPMESALRSWNKVTCPAGAHFTYEAYGVHEPQSYGILQKEACWHCTGKSGGHSDIR